MAVRAQYGLSVPVIPVAKTCERSAGFPPFSQVQVPAGVKPSFRCRGVRVACRQGAQAGESACQERTRSAHAGR